MGNCSGKPVTIPTRKVVKEEGFLENDKRAAKNQEIQARKHLKHKAAVVDARLQNDETEDAPTAIILNKSKSSQDIRMIENSLQRHFIFSSLTDDQKKAIVSSMKMYELDAGQVIFRQGTKGTAFFIVSSGRVEVIVNEKRVNVLKAGDSFGELALIHDTLRSASIITIIKTTLWCVNRTAFRNCLEELNAQNYNENRNFINSIPAFEALSYEQKEALVGSLSLLKFPSGTKVVYEGDSGDLLYFIKEGTAVCTKQGKEVRTIGKGDYFGEQALFYGTTRTATVISSEELTCVALGREDLISCLGAALHLIIYKNTMRIAFDKNFQLSKLSKEQGERLISEMEIQSFPQGQLVVPAGTEKKEGFYVVVKGELCNSDDPKVVYQLLDVIAAQDVITESAEVFEKDLVANSEVDIAHISSSGFFNCIGGDFEKITAINEAMESLKKVQLFKGLNNELIMKLVVSMKIQDFSDGQEIVMQNSTGENFYLIKSGVVEIIKDRQSIRSITKNDYFGERSLLLDNHRSASVVARKKVTCWVMTKHDFIENLDEKIRKQLLERIALQDANSTPLSELTIVKSLGNGMFGNVFLVIHKGTDMLYALKTVSRLKIQAYEIEDNIVLERKILMQLDHNLIMKLIRTGKDSKRLYFLMEYIRGMDLFDVIRKLNLLKECDARFYVGCILNILEHLHEREIIFRDLKPENMVVDPLGYPKLIDFGTAKVLRGRAYTIVGTPHYMAPEVVTGHGYTLSADYWTLGIMLFEFMFGGVPFGEDEDDPYGIYQKIQEHRLVFPVWVDNKNKVKEFIAQLLSKNPPSRLGGSFSKLRAHPWLIGFNWDKLMSKELKAPLVPTFTPLDLEIQTALKMNKTMDEVISKVEHGETIHKSKRKQMPPVDWDSDF